MGLRPLRKWVSGIASLGDHEQHGAGEKANGVGDGHAAGEPHPEQGPERFQQTAGDGHQHGQRGRKLAAHTASATASPRECPAGRWLW